METLPTKDQVEKRANQTFEKLMAWAREEFDIPNFSAELKLIHRENGQSWAHYKPSKGYYTNIAIYNLYTYPVIGFYEYASFEHDPVIGGFMSNDWKLWLDSVLAHEISHLVQFYLGRNLTGKHCGPISAHKQGKPYYHGLGHYEDGHGPFFQAIYAKFRKKFINRRVKDKTSPHTEFDLSKRYKGIKSPLKGIKVVIGGKTYKVVGPNPNTRQRLFNYIGYQVDVHKYCTIKLGDIVKHSSEAMKIANTNSAVKADLENYNKSHHAISMAARKRRLTNILRRAA